MFRNLAHSLTFENSRNYTGFVSETYQLPGEASRRTVVSITAFEPETSGYQDYTSFSPIGSV